MRKAPLVGCGICFAALLLAGHAPGAESGLDGIVNELLNTFDKISTSLATIKDEPTAQTAIPDLKKAAQRFSAIRDRAKKEKPPSRAESERLKKKYGEKLEAASKKLMAEIARLKQVPGGDLALKEIRLVVDKRKGPPADRVPRP